MSLFDLAIERSSKLPVWLQGDITETAPTRPQPEPQCTNEKCPIKTPHAQGYLHNQGPLPVGKALTAVENPPEEMLALLGKLHEGTINEEDVAMMQAFSREHVEPCLNNGILMSHTKREQCLDPGCSIEEPHGQGLYFHDRRQNWLKTEKFRFSNPPPEIWEADHRIEHGWGSEEELTRDRLVVDTFVALHGDKVMTRTPAQLVEDDEAFEALLEDDSPTDESL